MINDVMRAPPTGPEDEFSTVNKKNIIKHCDKDCNKHHD